MFINSDTNLASAPLLETLNSFVEQARSLLCKYGRDFRTTQVPANLTLLPF